MKRYCTGNLLLAGAFNLYMVDDGNTVPEGSGSPAAISPGILRIITLILTATLLFTTVGIWLIDQYLFHLDDLQWILLIIIPWGFCILLLTTAFVLQLVRGITGSWHIIKK